MLLSEGKRAEALRILSELYPNPRPELNYTSPYELPVAVMLSAQCTDKQVNKVTAELFQVANTPEKMLSLFCYSQMTSLPDYGDMKAGEFVDYILNNYRTGTNYTGGFNGMTVSQQGIYSQEFALNYYATAANLATSRNGGYGAHMVFSLDPFNSNYESRQLPALQLIATSFYDEELVDDGVRYRKDW